MRDSKGDLAFFVVAQSVGGDKLFHTGLPDACLLLVILQLSVSELAGSAGFGSLILAFELALSVLNPLLLLGQQLLELIAFDLVGLLLRHSALWFLDQLA